MNKNKKTLKCNKMQG